MVGERREFWVKKNGAFCIIGFYLFFTGNHRGGGSVAGGLGGSSRRKTNIEQAALVLDTWPKRRDLC